MSSQDSVRVEAKDARTITDSTYASIAESITEKNGGRDGRPFGKLTSSKLRGIYGLITNVSTRVNSPEEFARHVSDIQYVKVRMAYEAGREQSVKDFLEATSLMKLVDGIDDYEQFKLYCRYAEALVAYFKYFGGKD